MSRVWLLNLDAEIEVEGRVPYPGPLAAINKRPALVDALAALIPEGDARPTSEPRRGELVGYRGFCWSPTPRAAATLSAAGAEIVRPVPVSVLRRVMSRGFAAGLGLELPGSCWLEDAQAAMAHARSVSPSGRWLARRAYGFAGKARRAFAEALPADQRFVEAAALEGGVLLEPFVTVTADYGLHGFVAGDRLEIGEPVTNQVGAGGVFRGARRASDELASSERARLLGETRRAGEALRSAGYRGPYGVDAFRYTLAGREAFQPRCEINPRYSMAWAIGMGDRRPDLE